MKVKHYLPLILLLVTTQFISAQNIKECREIAEKTFEALNEHSSVPIENVLSADFTIAGQKGVIAKKVISQLFSQLNDSVVSFSELNKVEKPNSIELNYLVEYKNKGQKKSSFIFNEQNKLQELSLFEMEVKTLSEQAKLEKTSEKFIEIPFELARKLIAVEVVLNGTKRNFLLDTGSPRVILNSRHLQKPTEETLSSTKDVNNNIVSGMDIIDVRSLIFAGIELKEQRLVTSDLEHLEKSLGFDIYGIIGHEMIRDYDILFDYKNKKITLIDPEYFEEYSEIAFGGKHVILPIHMRGHIPTVQSRIGNRTFTLGIDSGAESNLLNEDFFENLEGSIKQIKSDVLKGGSKESKNVKTAILKRMYIGGEKFKNIPTVFSDLSHLNKNGSEVIIEGLVGYPILSKQKTLISFKRKELILVH